MPAKDSMPHRGASAVRNARRFAPYRSADGDVLAPYAPNSTRPLRPHASHVLVPSPPETTLIPQSVLSSTATLTSSSFSSEKGDSPESTLSDKSDKLYDSAQKCASAKIHAAQALQQRKVEYFTSLMDYGCKILSEIWPHQCIPPVFRYTNGAAFGYTPSTVGLDVERYRPPLGPSDLIKLRTFVYELVRRSKTSCTTLQTALCYIEAIRHHIPELQQAEITGYGIRGEQVDHEGSIVLENPESGDSGDSDTASRSRSRKRTTIPATPLPLLPSALLCPRRTFMAALVLAAKFVQDKCYSNRAWSKLSGIPPREVSRCERALGEALGWRLWVGKEAGFTFSGFESIFGKEPTYSQILSEEVRKECFQRDIHTATSSLHQLTMQPTEIITPLPAAWSETFANSPTPSLVSSATSSGSTQNIPTPQSTFVSNDPCSPPPGFSAKHGEYRQMYYGGAPMYAAADAIHEEQDAFGIRRDRGSPDH